MQTLPTPLFDWVIILPVLLPLMGAALIPMLGRGGGLAVGLTAAIIVAAGASELALLLHVFASGPLAMTMGRWLPPFGISFTADVMGATFALTAAVVTLVVLVYARMDAAAGEGGPSFHALVLLLLAGVDGAFLTGDMFNLYVWFEVMLIASFGLLVLTGTPRALDGTVKYGIVNFVATSLFLLGLGLLYGALGTLNMADIIGAAGRAPAATMTAIAALLLLAFGIKAAALPVNGWLPASYHTPPAAVSALLGGLLTKAGVYALLRTLVLVLPASRDLLEPVVALVAAATLVLAPLAALAETNLRRAIGYFLIGGIGAAITGIALASATALGGSVTYVVNSMLAIGALYLVAGLIERLTGETDVRRMGGLYTASPRLAVIFPLLIATIAGVPPFLGFWPKLLLLRAAVEQSAGGAPAGPGAAAALPLAICLLVNALLTLIAGARLWSQIFWREPPEPMAREVSLANGATTGRELAFGFGATMVLAALVVLAGLWPAPLLALGSAAAGSLLDPVRYVAAVGLGVSP